MRANCTIGPMVGEEKKKEIIACVLQIISNKDKRRQITIPTAIDNLSKWFTETDDGELKNIIEDMGDSDDIPLIYNEKKGTIRVSSYSEAYNKIEEIRTEIYDL